MKRLTTTFSVWVDESEKGDFLAVGGVIVPWDGVPDIVNEWRNMKEDVGLDPDMEVKWNLPEDHPTRRKLELQGQPTRELKEKTIEFISSQKEITCVVAVMFEKRSIPFWKRKWKSTSVRDFYCEGLRYVLQRVAEETVIHGAQSCVVVCDTPELGKKRFKNGSIRRGPKAVEEVYAEWYNKKGVDVGPSGQYHNGPLRSIRFHPSVLIGDASYHDMLQIADVVVGVTKDWIYTVRTGKNDSWVIEQIRKLKQGFRGKPDFFGNGLILWPSENKLWQQLRESLKE